MGGRATTKNRHDSEAPPARQFICVRLGHLVGYLGPGQVVVDVYEPNGPLACGCLLDITDDELMRAAERGARVKVGFEAADLKHPILIEVIPGGRLTEASTTAETAQRMEGVKSIVLRCGKTSVTLRPDGKVLVEVPPLRVAGGEQVDSPANRLKN